MQSLYLKTATFAHTAHGCGREWELTFRVVYKGPSKPLYGCLYYTSLIIYCMQSSVSSPVGRASDFSFMPWGLHCFIRGVDRIFLNLWPVADQQSDRTVKKTGCVPFMATPIIYPIDHSVACNIPPMKTCTRTRTHTHALTHAYTYTPTHLQAQRQPSIVSCSFSVRT